jgi:hypothetical protein
MNRSGAIRGLAVLLAGVASLAGCGGSGSQPASLACEGVVVRGACWVADGGISLTLGRVARVVARAEAYWDYPPASLNGWRVEIRRDRVVVDGAPFDGYCWTGDRLVVATPFAPDCFERSAIFHELGHAWGFPEDDPRMSDMWPVIRAAMEDSRWDGCSFDATDARSGRR